MSPFPAAPRPKTAQPARPALARGRARVAGELLADCHLCAHHCGVDRLAGELGICRAGAHPRCFSAQFEVGEELELVPAFAIAFSGCDLRCDFCITGESSWNPMAGAPFDARTLGAQARHALARGARTVLLLGGEPTIHLPAVLELVAELPASARLVWKTNAHASLEARAWLQDMFDVWVADFKFGNDTCAYRLARISDYLRTVTDNLLWADSRGDLIVRHLLMPGHLECCWERIATWLAANLPQVKVSLRAGFWPAWHAARHPELRRTVPQESQRAFALARELGLTLVP